MINLFNKTDDFVKSEKIKVLNSLIKTDDFIKSDKFSQ